MNSNRWLSFLVVVVALVFASEITLGQVKITQTRIDRTASGQLRLVPDPESKWSCLFLLINDRSIQQFLGLSEEVRSELSEIGKELKYQQGEVMAFARKNSENVSLSVMSFREGAGARVFGEILTPKQQQLLRNLVYRLEIQRVGLGQSLTSGRLAEAVGVHEGQKESLLRAASKIQKALDEEIKRLRDQAESELFNELAPEQKSKAIELTKGTTGYREQTRYQAAYAEILEEMEQGIDPFTSGKPKNPNAPDHHPSKDN